jgi:hypothetical protein
MIEKKPVQPYFKPRLSVVHKREEKTDQGDKKDKKANDPYKKWKMPEQPCGYIKSRKHDSL